MDKIDQLVIFLIGASAILLFLFFMYGMVLLSTVISFHQKGYSLTESFKRAVKEVR